MSTDLAVESSDGAESYIIKKKMKDTDIIANINLTLMVLVRTLKISRILVTVFILEEEIFRKINKTTNLISQAKH